MLFYKLHNEIDHPKSHSHLGIVVPFYQPIVDQRHQVTSYEVLARRWDPVTRCYQGIEFKRLGDDDVLHIDIVMLKAVLRDLPTLAKRGACSLYISLNSVMLRATYQQLLLWLLLKARRQGISIRFDIFEHVTFEPSQRRLLAVLRDQGANIAYRLPS